MNQLPERSPRRPGAGILIALLALALAAALGYQIFDKTIGPQELEAPAARAAPPGPADSPAAGPAARALEPEEVGSNLPPEVHQTLDLIWAGGPFPYRQDGSIFQNREGRLPTKPRGYYREYTVRTPGEDDRGARRIVRGQGGETWYTPDHYETFVRLDQAPPP